MTYRDEALAAYEEAQAEQAAAQQQQEDALIAEARKAARPLFSRGGALLDPMPETRVARVDSRREVVIFDVLDGSEISFAVSLKNDGRARRFLVNWVDGEPTRGDEVETLDQVGAALAEEG